MQTGEFELIELIKEISKESLNPDFLGIGDDAAIIPAAVFESKHLVLCSDTSIEGVHFCRKQLSDFDIGWKSLAVSISDIAAMGASPVACLISIQIPKNHDVSIPELYRGITACAKQFSTSVVGGDTVAANQFGLVSSVVGMIEKDKKAFKRSNAMVGEKVWVSSKLGTASLGLKSFSDSRVEENFPNLVEEFQLALRRPVPEVALANFLSTQGLCGCAIDISDGFLQDLGHIAKASDVKIVIDEQAVPLYSKDILARQSGFAGGEDYKLIFTSSANSTQRLQEEASDLGIYTVGQVLEGEAGVFVRSTCGNVLSSKEFVLELGLKSLGYSHF